MVIMSAEVPFRAPVHWRLKKQRYKLVGEVCPHCDTIMFPPRDVCLACGENTEVVYEFRGMGEIQSFEIIFDPPAGSQEKGSYTIALIKLSEGPLITAQSFGTDPDKPLKIGDPVNVFANRIITNENGNISITNFGFKQPATKVKA
jgi:uncharacterized OB-fold protein